MAITPKQAEYSLVLKRRFAASREEVFRAWTDPQALMQWFAPSDDFKTPTVSVDARVGGAYRIEMLSPEGKRHIVVGRYREVRPPERLVFSWEWESDEPEAGVTVVTVELRQVDGGTELSLKHEGFPTSQVRDLHEHGHSGCLTRLERLCA